MATLKNGILGSLSGMIGPVVVSTWKKILCIRGKPRKSSKIKKGSVAQVSAREKFKYLSQFLLPFQPYVYVGFINDSSDKTELNAAFSANFHSIVLGKYPQFSIDYAQLKLSKGNLLDLSDVVVIYNKDKSFDLKWSIEYTRGGYVSDQVVVVIYNEKNGTVDGAIGLAQRRDGQCSFKIDDNMKSKPLHLYVFLTSSNRRRISNTQYLGLFSL